ncbi:MAG: hypothetical protein H6686_09010 [Fibrobacteria bacterium]|nr:hypothetical protein [Fibrobacteria bacterium]
MNPSGMQVLRHVGPHADDPSHWREIPDSSFEIMNGGAVWLGWKSGKSLLRIPLEVRRPGRWWVLVDYPGIDSVRVECGGKASGWIGDGIPRSRWSVPWHAMWMPIDLDSGRQTTHIQVVGSHGRLGLVVKIYPETEFFASMEHGAVRDGFLLGLLVANLLVAIWLALIVRRPSHLWYVVYELFVVLLLTALMHRGWGMIWREIPMINHIDRTTTSIALFGAMGLFLVSLLSLRNHFPRMGTLLWGGSLFLLLCAASQLLYPVTRVFFELLYFGNRIEILEIAVHLLSLGLVAARTRKDLMARWVLLAMLPMAVSLVLGVLAEVLHLPWMYEKRTILVACALVLENSALSFALVTKVIRERREHQRVLERLLELERNFADRLTVETERHLRGTALDLHDGIGQDLAAAGLWLRGVLHGNPEVAEKVGSEMRKIIESVRQSARRIYPPELMEGGLRSALDRLAESWMRSGELRIEVRGDMPEIAESEAVAWYRIAQETVGNAVRHGRAREVLVEIEPGSMTITNDGSPFPGSPVEGMGLRGMRRRAQMLGCTMECGNSPTGDGVVVRIRSIR